VAAAIELTQVRKPAVRVLLSGCHSGPSPSSGLGVARSLREAFPYAWLVAKDHSVECSGMHHEVFDETSISRPWAELDLAAHRSDLAAQLAGGSLFLSGLDLEAAWLAEQNLDGALVAPANSFQRLTKPAVCAMAGLPGVAVPPWASMDADQREVLAFARHHDWRVWVKGPAYEAKRATNWQELRGAHEKLADTWGNAGLHVQAEVKGTEVSIAVSAFRGEMLDAVFMEKRQVTETGKTWAGAIANVPPGLLASLRAVLGDLCWTGGMELEFVRDTAGLLWLIDLNPRFPAWIHGATLAGRNLPARLVTAATGIAAAASPVRAAQFTRVVVELPVRSGSSLLPLRSPDLDLADAAVGKHPSGMPAMHRRLNASAKVIVVATKDVDAAWVSAVQKGQAKRPTPCRVLLHSVAADRFAHFTELARHLTPDLDVAIGYSVKTNPDFKLLQQANEARLLAEVISPEELKLVQSAGFSSADVIYNGPLPLPSALLAVPLRAIFSDSLPALARNLEHRTGIVGIRVRPPGVQSRFGLDVEDAAAFAELVSAMRSASTEISLGLSMHVQSSVVGIGRWSQAVRALIEFASTIEQLTGRPVVCLDVGGGWEADDFADILRHDMRAHVTQAKNKIRGLANLILEPGKALIEPAGVTLTQVVELRQNRDGSRDAVIDGSIAELPMSLARPHRVVAVQRGRTAMLPSGGDRILGRLCLEFDILRSQIGLPEWLQEGDQLWFCDSGAYDVSMGHPFGRGTTW